MAEEQNIPELYEKLRKKYSLPTYDSLNNEFEISAIEQDFVLRNVIRCVMDKLDFYGKLIDAELLQPDTSLASLHESKFISNSEKMKVYELFMQIMFLERWAIETILKRSEKEEAEYITVALKEWQTIRKELLPFISTIKEAWTNKKLISQEINYFG